MSRKPSKPPSYGLHKASGQAVVRISGRDLYLGMYGTLDSHRRYEQALAQWRAGQSESQLSLGISPEKAA